jgi:hypothetical protein
MLETNEIDNLINEVKALITPNSLKEFSEKSILKNLAVKIDLTITNNYDSTSVLYISKSDIISFFEPKFDLYIKDDIKHQREAWYQGKNTLVCHLENIKIDLEQKKIIISGQRIFLDSNLIADFKSLINPQFDPKKLIVYFEELNKNYRAGNVISCILLIRAVLNYVPPVFGQTTFIQVISQCGRSLKDIFDPLEQGIRKIADLHTHQLISNNETCPTLNQIESYKPQFEVLVSEIWKKIK